MLVLLAAGTASPAAPEALTSADGEGIFRRNDTDKKVTFVGVTYSTPFAYGYRTHGYVGADWEETGWRRGRARDPDVARRRVRRHAP